MKRPNWFLIGAAGLAAAGLLGLMAFVAVVGGARYVIFYARHGPIPGQKVARPVEDFARPSLAGGGQAAGTTPERAPDRR